MSNFIADFLEYNSGTECHKAYLRWAAISALCTVAGPRYRLLNGTYYIYPIMYIIYVGSQGNRKTYAMGRSKELIMDAFSEYPIAANITSRDDLIRLVASDETERMFIDQEGAGSIYHPLALFVSEFKTFTSYNPSMMIDFLVDIYDYVGRIYHCSTIKRGAEDSTSPFLSILACENTDWFIRRLKEGIVTGGFSRRFIVVYEYNKPDKPIPRIIRPENHKELMTRMTSHLRKLHTTAKDYEWTTEGQKFFDKWYEGNFYSRQEDSSIAGFMSTLDQQVLKLCIALDLAEDKPGYKITKDLVEESVAWYGLLYPNLQKLYASGGRNELMGEWLKLLELIDSRNGIMNEKELMRLVGKDLGPMELYNSIKYLCDSEQLTKMAFIWPNDGKNGVKTWLISSKGMGRSEVREAMRAFNNGSKT